MRRRGRKRPVLKAGRIGEYEIQLIVGLLVLELISLGYMCVKGAGFLFLQTLVVLIPISALSCFLVLRYQANRLLVIFTFLMLNFGFVSQYLTSDNPSKIIASALLKYVFAFLVAYLAAFCFLKYSTLISLDIMVPVITSIQIILCAMLVIPELYQRITNKTYEGKEVLITLQIGPISIQPMELIKILYIFVVVILFCKEERLDKKICKLPRELYFIIYTIILAICSIIISELGTLLVMLSIGGVMMLIHSQNRKLIIKLACIAIVLFVGVAFILSLEIPQINNIEVVHKAYTRFSSFISPETANPDDVFHALQAKKALTMGGLFGPDAERYIGNLAMANDDMIFVNLVRHCGILMGSLMILAVFAIFYQSVQISYKNKDSYYSGLAFCIGLLLTLEAIIHIAYNIGIFPITGIPMYLVSEGVTSMTTGLSMIAILLVISTDVLAERKYEDEENFTKGVRMFLPRRRSTYRKRKK